MSFLIFVYRHQDIIRRKSELNLKLSEINRKMMDLQSYAASIGSNDGNISVMDMLNMPASMFGRASAYMMYSGMAAQAGAQQNFATLRATGQLGAMEAQMMQGQQQQNQRQQLMGYEQMVQQSLFNQQRSGFAEQEKKRLNVQEKELESQKASWEDQLKMLSAEEESVSKAEDEGAKKSAPQYVA